MFYNLVNCKGSSLEKNVLIKSDLNEELFSDRLHDYQCESFTDEGKTLEDFVKRLNEDGFNTEIIKYFYYDNTCEWWINK
jgi:hypothetical protein